MTLPYAALGVRAGAELDCGGPGRGLSGAGSNMALQVNLQDNAQHTDGLPAEKLNNRCSAELSTGVETQRGDDAICTENLQPWYLLV